MSVHLLVGEDPVARNRTTIDVLGNPPPEYLERFDIATDGGLDLAEAATTASLVGSNRALIATSGQFLTAASAAMLSGADPALPVVIYADRPLMSPVRRALPGATVTPCPLPTRRTASQWVQATGHSIGITVPTESCWSLADLACEPVGAHRIATAFRLLATVDLSNPSPDQVSALIAGPAPSVAWRLTDAIEAGDTSAALAAVTSLDAAPALSAMSSRWIRLGHLLETGDPTAVPGLSPKAGAYALRAARGLGPIWIDDALRRTCTVQRRTRGGLSAAAGRLLTHALVAELTIGAGSPPN